MRTMEHESVAVFAFLAFSAKVATESQLERAGVASPDEARRLARSGLIGGKKVLVNPPEPLATPLATFEFSPGAECTAPDFGGLSRRVKARLPGPACELFVAHANRRTADMVGGAAARIRHLHLHHCLQVTESLIARGVPPGWRSEAFLASRGLSIGPYVPDAALVEGGEIARAVEYCGLYPPGRIEAIWRACRRTSTPVELW